MLPITGFRGDVLKLVAFSIAAVIVLVLLNSFLTDSVRPRIDKFAKDFSVGASLERAKDAVQQDVRLRLKRPEFTHKWEIVSLAHDRYRMSSTACSLESGERICHPFVAVVDASVTKRVESLRVY